ncbi:hypothetical protein AGMMS49944_15350 [Spirochaetia bacterium]|nr:hypothetical protein AGMMS49944_15350 [Spirochaetia bacterium]
MRLRDLLRHIYVLIPVFDFRKHYWIGDEEVEKLLNHGEGWLENHPAKVLITRRYFNKLGRLTRLALDRLDNGEGGVETTMDAAEETTPDGIAAIMSAAAENETFPFRLNTLRLLAVLSELKAGGVHSVIDLGCGEGNLLQLLMKEKTVTAIAGTDVSLSALERAAEKLKLDRLGEEKKPTLFQSSLCYRDKRFKGYDAAAIVEVIEHLDEGRLPALAQVVFGGAAPRMVIVTTPNAEYNANYPGMEAGRFRHADHRFEWNRAQFRAWADAVAARYGYTVRYEDVGAWDEEKGSPTQMGVFTK